MARVPGLHNTQSPLASKETIFHLQFTRSRSWERGVALVDFAVGPWSCHWHQNKKDGVDEKLASELRQNDEQKCAAPEPGTGGRKGGRAAWEGVPVVRHLRPLSCSFSSRLAGEAGREERRFCCCLLISPGSRAGGSTCCANGCMTKPEFTTRVGPSPDDECNAALGPSHASAHAPRPTPLLNRPPARGGRQRAQAGVRWGNECSCCHRARCQGAGRACAAAGGCACGAVERRGRAAKRTRLPPAAAPAGTSTS